MSEEVRAELLKWLRGELRDRAAHLSEAAGECNYPNVDYFTGGRDTVERVIAHIEALP